MTAIGYARACRFDPDVAMQEAALRAWGAEIIRRERITGLGAEGREELKDILRSIGGEDVLLVTRIDRLARGVVELRHVMRVLRARGAKLVVTEQPIVGERVFLEALSVFAEFEVNLHREVLLDGVERGKAKGRHRGRPKGIDHAQIRELRRGGMMLKDIAKVIGVSRMTLWKILGDTSTHRPLDAAD
jgi:DNA invertase Pin-like site-specific DNA recombinase